MVNFLIACGADLNHKAILGFTSLSFASQQGYLDMVNTLIANGADLNSKTDKLNTPLHLAAENGYPGIVNVLIEKWLDVMLKIEIKLDLPFKSVQRAPKFVRAVPW